MFNSRSARKVSDFGQIQTMAGSEEVTENQPISARKRLEARSKFRAKSNGQFSGGRNRSESHPAMPVYCSEQQTMSRKQKAA